MRCFFTFILFLAGFGTTSLAETPANEVILRRTTVSIELRDTPPTEAFGKILEQFWKNDTSNSSFKLLFSLPAVENQVRAASAPIKFGITISLKETSTYDALKLICDASSLQFAIDGRYIIISPISID